MRLLLRVERTKQLRCDARREFSRFASKTHILELSGQSSLISHQSSSFIIQRGSFEDEHSRSEARKERSGMKKQDSYLRAVGEVSPDSESKSDFSSISEINIRKQDSYIEAIRLPGLIRFSQQIIMFRSTSPLDEVPELPSRSRTTRRQASYLQAVQPDHLSAGERATFRSVLLQPLSSARSRCFILPFFTGLKEKFSDRLIFRMSQFLPYLNCLLAAITYV